MPIYGCLEGTFFKEVARLFNSTNVGSDCDFDHPVKAKLFHCGNKFSGGGVLAKLSYKRRCNNGDDPVSAKYRLNDLEYLTLVHYRAKRAAHEALTAGDALLLVYNCATMLICTDCVHSAGGGAGALNMDNGVIGTGVFAFAAAYALGLVNEAFSVDETYRILRADFLAGRCKAVLTAIGNAVTVSGTGVAGVRNNVDEWRLIVLFGARSRLHTVGEKCARLHGANTETHCETHALTCYGALEKDRFAVQRLVAGHNDIRQILNAGIVPARVCHAGDLGKDLVTYVGNK